MTLILRSVGPAGRGAADSENAVLTDSDSEQNQRDYNEQNSVRNALGKVVHFNNPSLVLVLN